MRNPAGAVLVGLALCLLPCAPAGAQAPAGSSVRGDSTAVFPRSAEERTAGIKSGTTAFFWSFLGTAVPAVAGAYDVYRAGSSDSIVPGIALVGGLVIGPSLGHFYAGCPGRALVGLGIRTLAGAGIAAAALEHAGESTDYQLEGLFTAGVVLGGASLAWDILSAPHSAHVHNDKARKGRLAVRITPPIGGAGFGLCVEVLL